MTKAEQILSIIKYIKLQESRNGRVAEDVYLKGNCGNFYRLLKSVFPEAEAFFLGERDYAAENKPNKNYIPKNHIQVKIGEDFYDIRGLRPKAVAKGFYRRQSFNAEVDFMSNNYEVMRRDVPETEKTLRGVSEMQLELLDKYVELDQKYHEKMLAKVKQYFEEYLADVKE